MFKITPDTSKQVNLDQLSPTQQGNGSDKIKSEKTDRPGSSKYVNSSPTVNSTHTVSQQKVGSQETLITLPGIDLSIKVPDVGPFKKRQIIAQQLQALVENDSTPKITKDFLARNEPCGLTEEILKGKTNFDPEREKGTSVFETKKEVRSLARRGGAEVRGIDVTGVDESQFTIKYNESDPPSMEARVKLAIDGEIGNPPIGSGGVDVSIQKWQNGEGFSLLLDVTHASGKAIEGEWTNLEIYIPTDVGKRSLSELIKWPEVDLPHGKQHHMNPTRDGICLQPLCRRSQVVVNVAYQDIKKVYPWFNENFEIAVLPQYSRPGDAQGDYRFHSTPPISKPVSGVRTGGRMEFDVVPVNKSMPLSQLNSKALTTHQIYLDPKTKVTSSMETEAEFTVGNMKGSGIRDLYTMAQKIDALKDPITLSELMGIKFEESEKKEIRVLLEKIKTVEAEEAVAQGIAKKSLGKQKEKLLLEFDRLMSAKGGWSLDGPSGSKDVLDSTSKRTKQAPRNNPLVDKYGVAPERPELQRLGCGRPGMLEDVYLHVGDDGVIRERRNFIGEGVMTVKGAHRRDERDQNNMARYCRQIECGKDKQKPVYVEEGVYKLHDGVDSMLFDKGIDFHDAIGKDDNGSTKEFLPKLSPQFVVSSERYRYHLTYHGTTPHTGIELSLDISQGWKLKDGVKQDSPITFTGFEFGLDHLAGVGGGSSTVPVQQIVSTSKGEDISKGEQTSKGEKEKEVDTRIPQPVNDRPLDRQDLNHKSVLDSNGPTYRHFQRAVHTITSSICEGMELRRGGEKAKTMLEVLNGGELPQGMTPDKLFPSETQ